MQKGAGVVVCKRTDTFRKGAHCGAHGSLADESHVITESAKALKPSAFVARGKKRRGGRRQGARAGMKRSWQAVEDGNE